MTSGNIAGALACEDTLQRKVRQIISFPHLYIILKILKKMLNFNVDIRLKATLAEVIERKIPDLNTNRI